MNRPTKLSTLFVVAGLLIGACGGSVATSSPDSLPATDDIETETPDDVGETGDPVDGRTEDVATEDVATEDVATEDDPTEFDASLQDQANEWYDPEAQIDCSVDNVGEESGPVQVIYRVDEGELGEPCFGEDIPALRELWEGLAELTTPEMRLGVRLFSGFEGSSENDLLAYAGDTLEAEFGEQFVVAAELGAVDADPGEARLTVLHELAHVFTQTPDQLEWHVDADDCTDTYWNESGCAEPDSYLNRWVSDFWTQDEIQARLEANSRDDLSVEICEVNPNFVGDYAATFPDEDLAESFSAYVFDLDVVEQVQNKVDWFAQYPEFVAMREAAAASSSPAPDNSFGGCGF